MKAIDRYITRELLTPIIYCSLSLIFLILIADLFDNLDEFMSHKTPLWIMGQYYLSLVPFAFVETIAWSTWLGTLFLLVNFGLHNELLAMKVAGLKITSIIRPMIFLGFLIGILTFIVSDRLVPWTYSNAKKLSEIYIEKKMDKKQGEVLRNVTFHSANQHLYYFRTLALTKKEAADVVILWLDRVNHKTRQKISALRAVWDGTVWEFEGVTEHQIDSRGKILGEPRTYVKKIYPEINASPKDLANTSRETIFLTYREMKRVMQQVKKTGVDVSSEMVDLHSRLASPWQSLLMMLITVPLLGPTRTRKGIAAYVFVCIGCIFAYYVTQAIGIALGKSGRLLPFVSAWAGNFIFGVAALLKLDKANF